MTEHKIDRVAHNSIAYGLGINEGDVLLSVNGQDIEDIFDYQYQCENESVDIEIRKTDGSVMTYHIDKDEDEDVGLEFNEGLMDEYRHCHNKCVFCFIDQNPPGMRDTIYFKDDDARLSFLQGNYITLTNMSDHDIDRIIKYRLQPVNISFHTMNPDLRCKMLNNRFAGETLKKVDRLYEAGIRMNGQIVLCKGINDGAELEYSLKELYRYVPLLESLSVVPVGLTRYRDGLHPLEPFGKEDAIEVISSIERWQQRAYAEHGTHFVHASDEWYINADIELPEEDSYDGYLQIENGVGMMRSMLDEFADALGNAKDRYGIGDVADEGADKSGKAKGHLSLPGFFGKLFNKTKIRSADDLTKERVCVITGRLAYGYTKRMADEVARDFPMKDIVVLPIENRFFGEKITVTGLLTGQDIVAQCKEYVEAGNRLGDRLLLYENMLRSGTDILLDDMTVGDISEALQIKIDIIRSSGYDFVDRLLDE